jgi:hypothetical protein
MQTGYLILTALLVASAVGGLMALVIFATPAPAGSLIIHPVAHATWSILQKNVTSEDAVEQSFYFTFVTTGPMVAMYIAGIGEFLDDGFITFPEDTVPVGSRPIIPSGSLSNIMQGAAIAVVGVTTEVLEIQCHIFDDGSIDIAASTDTGNWNEMAPFHADLIGGVISINTHFIWTTANTTGPNVTAFGGHRFPSNISSAKTARKFAALMKAQA